MKDKNETLRKAIELYNQNEEKLAYDLLIPYYKKNIINDKVDAQITYLIGIINYYNSKKIKGFSTIFGSEESDKSNEDFEGDIELAKRCITSIIDNDKYPISNAFIIFAEMNKDDNKHALNILNKGLKIFPGNIEIIKTLIEYLPNNEAIKFFEKNKTSGLEKLLGNRKLFELYYNSGNKQKSIKYLNLEIKDKNNDLNKFIKGLILIELGKVNGVKKLLESLIKEDITNRLEFLPHIALLGIFCENKDITNINKIINDISITGFEPIGNGIIDDILYNNYLNSIKSTIVFLENQGNKYVEKIAKLKGLLIATENSYYVINLNKKEKNNYLKYIIKNLPKKDINFYFAEIISNSYVEIDNFFDSFKFDLFAQINIDGYKNDFFYLEFVKDEKFIEYYKYFIKTVNSYSIEKLYSAVKPIISIIFKKKQYKKVVEIYEINKSFFMKNFYFLFEIAYSYNEIGSIEISKNIYEILLNKENNNSSVLNNLGVIFEEEGNFMKAKELFKSALEKSKNSKLYERNVERIEKNLYTEKEEKYYEIGDGINIENISKLGLDQEIEDIIYNKILDKELYKIIIRDIEDNAIALISKSYKSSLILSGAIIEGILLYLIQKEGINNYLPGETAKEKKDIYSMNLGELLYVSTKEKITNNKNYHLSNILKDYRNIVHPGNEIRKFKNIDLEDEAKLAWELVKRIIKSI